MDHPMRALAKSSVSEHVPPSHMEILPTTSVGAVSWSPLLRHRVDLSIEPTPFETKGASVGGMDGSADINYLSEVNRRRDRHLDNLVTWERMPTSTSIGCATIIYGGTHAGTPSSKEKPPWAPPILGLPLSPGFLRVLPSLFVFT